MDLNPMSVLGLMTERVRMFALGLLLLVLGNSAWAADIPASPVFYGFNAGTVNVYAEIAGPKAIIVFGCAGSSATQVHSTSPLPRAGAPVSAATAHP